MVNEIHITGLILMSNVLFEASEGYGGNANMSVVMNKDFSLSVRTYSDGEASGFNPQDHEVEELYQALGKWREIKTKMQLLLEVHGGTIDQDKFRVDVNTRDEVVVTMNLGKMG